MKVVVDRSTLELVHNLRQASWRLQSFSSSFSLSLHHNQPPMSPHSTKGRGFCPFSLVLFGGTAYSSVKLLQSKSEKKSKRSSKMTDSRCRPVVICGPSGVGKGTLIELLQKQFPDYKFGVSVQLIGML